MMMKAAITATALGLLAGLCAADEPLELKTANDRINYAVGYQMGGDFKRQGVAINPQAMIRGIQDALSDEKPLMTTQEMRSTLVALKRRVVSEQRAKLKQQAEENLRAGEAFLAENAKKEGVKTTASGLQYKVLKAGTGKTPAKGDSVTVHYRGRLIDGTEFDSSYSRGEPITFKSDRVIAGWTEALLMMQEGAKWELYIPAKLAYGARGAGDRIPPNSALIFDVELIKVD